MKKLKINFKTSIVSILMFLIIVGSFFYLFNNKVIQNTKADYIHDDNKGFWLQDFSNSTNLGLAPALSTDSNNNLLRQNIDIDTVNGKATILGTNTSATITTSVIKPLSFNSWGKIYVGGNISNSNDVKIQLFDCQDPKPVIIPDTAIAGNSTGLTLTAGVLDISSLNKSNYPCIRVQLDLATSGIKPVIDELKVTWVPLPVHLIELSGNSEEKVGGNIVYNVKYSVSYVNDKKVVIWVPLPKTGTSITLEDGSSVQSISSYTSLYSQNINPTFVSASNGGSYTSSATSIQGISIPANSVYWDLGDIIAGTTDNLTFTLSTLNGTENGILYKSKAYIDSNLTDKISSDSDKSTVLIGEPTTTKLISTPEPAIDKSVSNVVELSDKKYVLTQLPIAKYTIKIGNPIKPDVASTIGLENIFSSTGLTKSFSNTLTDDLSDIFDKLSNTCGVASPSTKVTNISNGGQLDIANKKIVWSYDDFSGNPATPLIIKANEFFTVSFDVDYSGCSDNLMIKNTAVFDADNITPISDSETVTFRTSPLPPEGTFAKGDEVNGKREIVALQDDNSSDTNPSGYLQSFGDTFKYILYAENKSIPRLEDVYMIDQIPSGISFISANLPSGVTGTIYYNTTGGASPATPPFDYNTTTGILGASWTTSLPGDPTIVKWVAFKINCISSKTSVPALGNICPNSNPSSVAAEIKVKINNSNIACAKLDIPNTGNFYAYKAGDSTSGISTIATPLTLVDDKELTHVKYNIANFNSIFTNLTGPNSLNVGDNGTYTLTIKNDGNDLAKNTQVNIRLPQIEVNGSQQYLSLAGNVTALGGTLDLSSLSSGLLKVNFGDIAINDTRNITFSVNIPKGVIQNDSYNVISEISASDDQNCEPIKAIKTLTTTVHGQPKLSLVKNREEAIIDSGDKIHYSLTYSSIGDTPTTKTFIVDSIPSKTIFDEAYTHGTDDLGKVYTCGSSSAKCNVYFSKSIPPLLTSEDITKPFDISIINNNFTLGVESSSGVWKEPAGFSKSEIKYVAYLVDDVSLNPDMLPVNKTGVVGLRVKNDVDINSQCTIINPATTVAYPESCPGEMIFNHSAILSSELLQANSNEVITTVLPDPGLKLKKSSTPDYYVGPAGQSFTWQIEYINDSANDDTLVEITDTLPYGVKLNAIKHVWNSLAFTDGASDFGGNGNDINSSSTYDDITSNANITSTLNPDGTTTLKFDIDALRNGNLKGLEGGKIVLELNSLSTLLSNTTLLNTANGKYENLYSGGIVAHPNVIDPVVVINPDLWLKKLVNRTDPIKGEQITYTLIVSNEGGYDAKNVKIIDVIPNGMSYVANSVQVQNSNWTIGEPTVTGSGPYTLTWDNVIDSSTTNTGTIPANSEDILITYKVLVSNTVNSGDSLTNGAVISNIYPEDPTYPNNSDQTVTVPLTDLTITKSAVKVIKPGDDFEYTIQYSNLSRQEALNPYLIDKMPDNLNTAGSQVSDGLSDIILNGVTTTNGETVYYNSASLTGTTPVFDYTNPTSNGWSTTYSNNATYIAIKIPSPLSDHASGIVELSATAKNPVNNNNLPAGVSFTNNATVATSSIESTLANNTTSATVKTLGIDLAIEKKGSIEGAFPGIEPGANIEYEVKYSSLGSDHVCGIVIEDILDSNLTFASPSSNFATATISDLNNNEIKFVTTSNADINFTVKPTEISSGKWVIGSNVSSNQDYYLNICMPASSSGTFKVFAKVKDSVSDKTAIINNIKIYEDSPSDEIIPLTDPNTNNTDSSSTIVYRADLLISKSGHDCGIDNDCNTLVDNNDSVTTLNRNIQYKLEYNNAGNIDAKNSIINEIIPAGSCYEIGSIEANLPNGTTIKYYDQNNLEVNALDTNDGKTDNKDCTIKSFKLFFSNPLPAPATFDSGIDGGNVNICKVTDKTLNPIQGFKFDQSIFDPVAPTTLSFVKIGNDGSIYVGANGTTTKDMDPTAGVNNHTFALGSGFYITKLNPDGTYNSSIVWDAANVQLNDFKLGPNDEYLLTGRLSGVSAMDFDPGPGVVNKTQSGGGDMFLIKLDNTGAYNFGYLLGNAVNTDAGFETEFASNGDY